MTRYTIDPQRSQVWIEGSSSVHPIRATATGLTGWFDLDAEARAGARLAQGSVEVAVDRLRSGNALVDRETRRRIDARRYPTIVGEIVAIDAVRDDTLAVRGTIAFRGVTNEVPGELVVRPIDGGMALTGEAAFDVRRWGLEPPRVAMLKVHPMVRVRIAITATTAPGPVDGSIDQRKP